MRLFPVPWQGSPLFNYGRLSAGERGHELIAFPQARLDLMACGSAHGFRAFRWCRDTRADVIVRIALFDEGTDVDDGELQVAQHVTHVVQ